MADFDKIFLSTLSLRRATSDAFAAVSTLLISIHALLAESDYTAIVFGTSYSNFYPRSPCGERLKEVEKLSRVTVISIHALLAESDGYYLCSYDPRKRYFYPRSPCGERH